MATLEEFNPKSTRDSVTPKVASACGTIYLIVEWIDNKPVSISCPSVKPGGCLALTLETMCDQSRRILELGGTFDDLIKCFRGRSCHKSGQLNPTCTEAIATAIEIAVKERGDK